MKKLDTTRKTFVYHGKLCVLETQNAGIQPITKAIQNGISPLIRGKIKSISVWQASEYDGEFLRKKFSITKNDC